MDQADFTHMEYALHEQQAETLRLRKHLRNLFAEEKIVKAIVEAIVCHEIESDAYLDRGDMARSASETDEAGALQNALEECNLSIEQDESSEEIIHLMRGKQNKERLLSFHTAEWEWMQLDGTWPWKQTDTEHKDDDAWEAHTREGI